ncbi:hypothetical protein TNCV_4991251 [Trichonephila clavipes]|nr:hypothetical protein TNCV_4991251 [Trichonephila clavipes]
MVDSSSFVSPTPLAHADTSRDVLARGEEFGTVMKDDYDPNVDSEKELSLEQKLKLAITKKKSNQDTIQESDISKTI